MAKTTTKKRTTKKRTAKASTKKAAPKKATPKKATAEKGAAPKVSAEDVPYPKLEVRLYTKDSNNGVLLPETAKELLGWAEETDGVSFGNKYTFKDREGKKVRCMANLTNRPFADNLANDWMLEVLRRKWRFNGETMIVDRLGNCQDCQHRLVALVWAEQETRLNPDKWSEYWNGETPYMETLVVLGIDDSDDTVNTINVGKPRTLSDVLYRSEHFKDKPADERLALSRLCDGAMRLVWHRTGKSKDAYNPRRSHSESLDYLGKHPKILAAVNHVWLERESLRGLSPLAYAAGLLFLQGCSTSDLAKYEGSDDTLDWKLWDKACDFWVEMSNGAESLALLNAQLRKLGDFGGGYLRDCVCGYVAKSWNLVVDNKPLSNKGIGLKITHDEFGKPSVEENPTVGGIDIGGEIDE